MVPHPATYSWLLLVSAENSLLTNLNEPHTVLTGGMKMVFSSLVFLFHFLPLFLLLYYICPAKWKNAVLFAGSLIFYIYGVKMSPSTFSYFCCPSW